MSKMFINVAIKKKKIKKGSHKFCTSLGNHLLRKEQDKSRNVDRTKSHENKILIDTTNGETLTKTLNKFLKDNDLQTRNVDTVQAFQVVFSIDKRLKNDLKARELFEQKVKEFLDSDPRFKGNVLLCVAHYDEVQPHIQAICVPRSDGKLNFKKNFGGLSGGAKLARLHTEVAEQIGKPLGLSRGDGTHTNGLSHKEYMEVVEQIAEEPKEIELPKIEEHSKFAFWKTIEDQQKQIEELKKQNKAQQKEIAKSTFYSKQNTQLKANNTQLKKKVNQMRERAEKASEQELERIRSIDCKEVCERLGLQTVKEGTTTRVKNEEINLVISSNNKFTENRTMAQGYGAIDLMVKVFKYSFSEARKFLTSNFGSENTAKVILTNQSQVERTLQQTLEQEIKPIPQAKPQNIENIRKYLIEKRKLDSSVVDQLIKQEMIFADNKNNCVFVNSKKTFAFLRGTFEGKRFVGTRGQQDFIKYNFGTTEPTETYLFESAIDALSFYSQYKKKGQYVVLNGSAMINKIHELELDKKTKVFCCFDNDEQGQKFCDKVASSTTTQVEVVVPLGKDFNEDLQNGNKHQDFERRNQATATKLTRKNKRTK